MTHDCAYDLLQEAFRKEETRRLLDFAASEVAEDQLEEGVQLLIAELVHTEIASDIQAVLEQQKAQTNATSAVSFDLLAEVVEQEVAEVAGDELLAAEVADGVEEYAVICSLFEIADEAVLEAE